MVLLGHKALRLRVWASGFRVSRLPASIHSALMKVAVTLAYVPMNLHFYSRHLGFLLGWSVAVTSNGGFQFVLPHHSACLIPSGILSERNSSKLL